MKESSGQETHKSLKEKLVEIIRNYIKKEITGNLGSVVEEDDKLICFVNKENFKDFETYCPCDCSTDVTYYIDCVDFKEKYAQLVEKYNLNKQIVYVFDKLEFYSKVEIRCNKNSEIQVQNCKFTKKLKIETIGDCTLINTFIASSTIIKAKNLRMSGMDFFPVHHHRRTCIEFIIEDLIDVRNSNIGVVNPSLDVYHISLQSKLINISNSTLGNEYLTINGKLLQTEDCIEKIRESSCFGYIIKSLKKFN